MTESPDPNAPCDGDRHRPPHRWQFGLAALLGTMMLLCLPFALWGAILRANQSDQFILTLLCAAAPLGVVVLLAFSLSVIRLVRKTLGGRASQQAEEEGSGFRVQGSGKDEG